MALKKKNQGNVCFKDGDYETAIRQWTQALVMVNDLLDLTSEQKQQVDELAVSCRLNCAACYLKLEKYERCRDNCTEVLKLDPNNSKAFYRRGQALYQLKNFEEALHDLEEAKKIEPQNNDIKRTIKNVQDAVTSQKEREKQMFQRMFR